MEKPTVRRRLFSWENGQTETVRKNIKMPFSETEIALLKTSSILQDIPQDVVLEAILEHVDYQFSLQPDEVFINAGQVEPGLYIIAHGTIEMFMVDADKKEKVLDFAKTGGTLAEETLFSDRPLQYSARSLTQAAVLHLPNTVVSEWIVRYPAFTRRLMSLVSERINFLYKDMLTFCTKKATSRLICYIVCHFNEAPKTADGSYSLHLAIPRNKLASRLGISDSHLSRSFRELQEQGLIVPQARGYFIPDVPALSKYVCPGGCDF
jgi:CRP-like cAMP-binding protein